MNTKVKPKTRILQNGRKVNEEAQTVDMTLTTKCPKKWVVIDLETCDAWSWGDSGWTQATERQREEVQELLKSGNGLF